MIAYLCKKLWRVAKNPNGYQIRKQPIENFSKMLNAPENKLPFCSATYREGFSHVIEITFSTKIF